MKEQELKNLITNHINIDKKDVEVHFHSSNLFSLYKLISKKPINIKNKSFYQMAIKVIDNFQMALLEFESLQLLYNFHVRVPFPIDVLRTNDMNLLIMEFIDKTSISLAAKKDLIVSLKKLYSHRSLNYGFDKDNFIGTLIQKNSEYNNFLDFWWASRIEPMLSIAIENQYFSVNEKNDLFKIIKKFLSDWNLEKDQPRAIHGDLWSGNILFSNEFAYLIDPSFAYSHPVQDFAMLELFGSPLNFSDYLDIANYCNFSIKPEMIEFFQIYPLLVHVNIFGITYKREVLKFIQKFK
ncbi:MAG: fructosamine kinase family protein [Leptonema sp. (in: bacteria)]